MSDGQKTIEISRRSFHEVSRQTGVSPAQLCRFMRGEWTERKPETARIGVHMAGEHAPKGRARR
jgi:hypothetical protein